MPIKVERIEGALHQVTVEALAGHDDARSSYAVRPGGKMQWPVDDLLHAVDDDRRLHRFDIDQSLQAQNIAAVPVDQHRQPKGKAWPWNGLVCLNHESEDTAVLVHVMGMVVVMPM